MRLAITGATGMIGRALVTRAVATGHSVTALARDKARARDVLGGCEGPGGVELHEWRDPTAAPAPAAALRGADAVIHLLGEPVAQRWSDRAKRAIRASREQGTRNLVAAVAALDPDERPRALVSQSACGYYGARGDEVVTEDAPAGDDFLAQVVVAWEREAGRAAELGLRVACTRTGLALSPDGGALAKMLPPFKAGVGGPVAGGRQYVPWVHLDDVVAALLFCAQTEGASGPINLTAPHPVSNAELSAELGHVLHRPAFMPVPGMALRLLYGEMAMIITTGVRAVPARLGDLGFDFAYPELDPALHAVLDR